MKNQTTTTRAFIIKDDKLIASTTTDLKNGKEVYYAFSKVYDDLRQEEQLVNSRTAKISRAKKWHNEWLKDLNCPTATLIDNDAVTPRFFVSSDEECYCPLCQSR